MIDCKDFLAEIGNYFEGEVSVEVRRHLEAHLAHCKTCTVICDSARKTVRFVTDSGSFELPDATFKDLSAQIMARIRQGGKAR